VRRFQRRVEDFDCEHCGLAVSGTGYTNHCPRCLWSKHVDVNPGDRLEPCQGMMRPVSLEQRGKEYVLLHRCERCGIQRRNRSAPGDDFEKLLELARSASAR
jgi:hypothetical protein